MNLIIAEKLDLVAHLMVVLDHLVILGLEVSHRVQDLEALVVLDLLEILDSEVFHRIQDLDM